MASNHWSPAGTYGRPGHPSIRIPMIPGQPDNRHAPPRAPAPLPPVVKPRYSSRERPHEVPAELLHLIPGKTPQVVGDRSWPDLQYPKPQQLPRFDLSADEYKLATPSKRVQTVSLPLSGLALFLLTRPSTRGNPVQYDFIVLDNHLRAKYGNLYYPVLDEKGYYWTFKSNNRGFRKLTKSECGQVGSCELVPLNEKMEVIRNI